MINQPKIEFLDCFFCGKEKSCKFIDGKGYVCLGQSAGKKDFGQWPMCQKCRGMNYLVEIKYSKIAIPDKEYCKTFEEATALLEKKKHNPNVRWATLTELT